MRVAFFCLLLLAGCQSKQKGVTHFDGHMMTMHYHVIIGDVLNTQEKDHVQLAIDDTFFQVNQIFNRFNPKSELSRLNQLKSGEKMKVSDPLWELMILTDRIVHLTEGNFDPTVWTVQHVWKRHLENGEIPTPEELSPYTQAVGWHSLHLDQKMVWKDHTQTEIDLSGIAKGHAIDLLIKSLNERGYEDVYVEWGGEIAASGQHPEGRPWTIAITPPNERHPDHAVEVVSLKHQGAATSGDYIQYWPVKHERFTHIMNPMTLTPLKRCDRSVTVCAPSCAMADALATASMVANSPEDVQKWTENLEEVTCWFFAREDSGENVQEFEKSNRHP